jgi:hypothetical protein
MTGRYFYETNAMDECERTCDINMTAVEQLESGPQKEDFKATIISHQGQMAESLGYPERAVQLHSEGYKIRIAEVPLNRRLLCFTAANIGYSSSSANNHAAGLEWHNKAIEWWGDLPIFPLSILGNKARWLVYLGDFESAELLIRDFISQAQNAEYTNWAMVAQ